jgi:hypothetical protein
LCAVEADVSGQHGVQQEPEPAAVAPPVVAALALPEAVVVVSPRPPAELPVALDLLPRGDTRPDGESDGEGVRE